MDVLVGFATAHGSTQGIAKAIGDRLTQAGLQVDVRAIDAIEGLDGYDAVILGSAIHSDAWLPPASAFVKHHVAELATRPVWLFSVSSIGETSGIFGQGVTGFMRRMRKESDELVSFRLAVRPRGHRNFAGSVERSHWNLAGDLFLKAFGGTYGDHRDWQDIAAWADGIARDLSALPVSPAGRAGGQADPDRS
jgi:menaquinone-dependent protoporphyrinogen oxidase